MRATPTPTSAACSTQRAAAESPPPTWRSLARANPLPDGSKVGFQSDVYDGRMEEEPPEIVPYYTVYSIPNCDSSTLLRDTSETGHWVDFDLLTGASHYICTTSDCKP